MNINAYFECQESVQELDTRTMYKLDIDIMFIHNIYRWRQQVELMQQC